MKVVSVKTIKKEKYELIFDNERELILYEDVIVKNNLLNKEITEELYNQLLIENEMAELEYKAIRYIEIKLRSEKEVVEYLRTKCENEVTIEKIVSRLKSLNLINDALFAKSYALDKYNINRYGLYKITKGLEEHKINEDVILEAVSFITNEEQLSRIEKIVAKYITTNKKESIINLKKKIVNNLISKGYPQELIYEVVNAINTDDNKAIKKQYDKLYKKYVLKYSGDELSKMILKDLMKKGFTYEEIKKLEI